jgi:hypothetical protein
MSFRRGLAASVRHAVETLVRNGVGENRSLKKIAKLTKKISVNKK